MLAHGVLIHLASRTYLVSIVSLMFVSLPHAALIGCSGEKENGPVSSTLSEPANSITVPPLPQSVRSTEEDQAGRLLITSQSLDGETDLAVNPTPAPSDTDGSSPDSDPSDDVPMITVTSTPKGVTVQLDWAHPSDADAYGYDVYYGKHPAQETGSCTSYEGNQAVDRPPATIVGLEHDTIYYFAVKTFNEDACSEEMIVATPPAHS